MWSDSEDLAIIADIYQMKIKVITINRADNIPTVKWFYPDPNLREYADLKDAILLTWFCYIKMNLILI